VRDSKGRFIHGHAVLPGRDSISGKFVSNKSMVENNKDISMDKLESEVDRKLMELEMKKRRIS
jgi:hypothetical protein